MKAIRAWMITDKLKLNDEKAEFLIIGTRKQLSKVHTEKLSVGNVSVAPAAFARILGTWFDTNLSLLTQIAKTCKAAFYHRYNVRRFRQFRTMESTKLLVHAFIMGRIDYCNSLLYGLPAMHNNKMKLESNAAATLICSTPRFSQIAPILYSLQRLRGLAPEYICNLRCIKNPSTYGPRSNSELL